MAKAIRIQAENRDKVGKGASRAARRAGYVPAVIYGDKREPRGIQIRANEVVKLLNRGGFMSHTYEIESDGKVSAVVLPRDIQFHPVTDDAMHIDFLRLAEGATVVMEVPVHLTGEEETPGLRKGGTINFTRHTIELNVPAQAIPESITVSIADLDIGDSVKISDVTLPEGCVPTITDRDFVICAIVAPSSLKSSGPEGEDEDGEGEAAEGETTEAAAEE